MLQDFKTGFMTGYTWRTCSSTTIRESVEKPTADITFNASRTEEIAKELSPNDLPVDIPNPYEEEKLSCILCKYKVHVDYKNVRLLSQFISPYTGRVYGRHITRLCKQQQDLVEKEITKSRNAGFMPISLKSVEFLKDPKLFDPNNPIRPHKY
ncbi:mitochondrial ribosomal protein S18C isoform X2 [Oratosquilla oratoria]|uniref:mitochondrial ribosomal protein S18C isoform X2 n=1 Tax=Oratosquilla oratoria TaxID=337810 RepID=UPI003F777E79